MAVLVVAALWPGGAPLPLFALTAAIANLWMATRSGERHGRPDRDAGYAGSVGCYTAGEEIKL
jgi:hypothetical protein